VATGTGRWVVGARLPRALDGLARHRISRWKCFRLRPPAVHHHQRTPTQLLSAWSSVRGNHSWTGCYRTCCDGVVAVGCAAAAQAGGATAAAVAGGGGGDGDDVR